MYRHHRTGEAEGSWISTGEVPQREREDEAPSGCVAAERGVVGGRTLSRVFRLPAEKEKTGLSYAQVILIN